MNVWYLIVFVFFISCIDNLIDERYQVSYEFNDKSNSYKLNNYTIQYAICYNLFELFNSYQKLKDKIPIDESDLNFSNSTSNLKSNESNQNSKINEFNQNVLIQYFEVLLIDQIKNEQFHEINPIENTINKIKAKEYLIYKNHFCIISNNRTEIDNNYHIKHFVRHFLVINKNLNQFFLLKYDSQMISQLIVLFIEYPYSNCNSRSSNRFKCLNNCISKQQTLSKYYYDSNHNNTIKLDYENDSKLILENEKFCLKKCKRIVDCEISYFFPNNDNELRTVFLKAYQLTNSFNFFIQLCGLFCLFFGIHLHILINKLIKFLSFKFNKLRRYSIYFKVLVLSFCTIYLFIFYVQSIDDYLNKNRNPIKKLVRTNHIKPDLNVIICVLDNKITDNNSYYNKSLLELERETSFMKNEFNKIYLKFLDKKIYLKLTSKVIFKGLWRCFQIELIKEPKYISLFSLTKLIIKYNDNLNFEFYLVPKSIKFNKLSFKFKPYYLYIEKIKKRNTNCLNYKKKFTDCDSKQNCIDYCIIKQFRDVYKIIHLYYDLIIDKDQFTDDQYQKVTLQNNLTIYEKTKNNCEKMYSIRDCEEIFYNETFKNDRNIIDKNRAKFELYNDSTREIEENSSIYKLLMDLLNIESMLFGLNVFKLILILFNYWKIKFKYYRIFIYLLCLIGFSYHLWFIFNEIINGELIYSHHFKLEDHQLEIPNLIYCLNYRNSIDNNHKLTYEYLNNITADLNTKILFNKIIYLNKLNQWIELDKNSSFQTDDFKIDEFYFLGKKCFEIKLNLEYDIDQFEFGKMQNSKIIKIDFNLKFLENKNQTIYFLSRRKNTKQFSALNELSYNRLGIYSYTVDEELYYIELNDKFNFIKNPLSIFGEINLNNVNDYLDNLINNFKINFNLKTLNLPLYRSNLVSNNRLEINDELFNQFFIQIQNQTDHQKPSNFNYKKTLMFNIMQSSSMQNEPNFIFNLIFLKSIISITNEDNYAKLILNLLNAFSLWLDMCILDLQIYLDLFLIKIKSIFIYFIKFLLLIEIKFDHILFDNSI